MSVEYATARADLTSPVPLATRAVPPVATMTLHELAQHSQEEMRNYCQGKVVDDCYALEIFRRAMRLHDAQAWDVLYQCFSGIVYTWMRRHSKRERAYALDSEENYVAQAFTRLWQASMNNAELHFTSVAAALNYLRASLNGAIMDTLRVYNHPNEVSLPDDNDTMYSAEPVAEEPEDTNEVWYVVRSLLSDPREIRLAYLYFHCGLKAREIVHFCPTEFNDVQDIYRLRHNIFKRLTRNADLIRWRLS
ncbi:hypothetical protein KDA_36470 [Dictyobacter alpinus]|uniref:Uncharacterized protein n=1 Tax=Dictyobacter alpinus TaxID=2014873 RepID=A0A402B9T6_9CHLR|nr:sigma-70 family RNA polymerase sigma factor [Dictyobacter alpinus]GCE28163.1 hypothetical protein KDA_36470 [Dictyobacter alpinus]